MGDWIIEVISAGGYFGIILLMMVETVFPPIPSELVLPFAGYAAAKGELNVHAVAVSGLIGSLLGAILLYGIGRLVKDEKLIKFIDKYGVWLTVNNEDIAKARQWFDRYSNTAVLIARIFPAIRSLISLPAGVNKMKFAPFVIFSGIGTAIWMSVLTYSGYFLGQDYMQVEQYINPFAKVVVYTAIVIYLFRLLRPRNRRGFFKKK